MPRREAVVYDLHLLCDSISWGGFTNIEENHPTEDEDVWINMLSHKDMQNRDEFVLEMSNNKECKERYEVHTKLISRDSVHNWRIQSSLGHKLKRSYGNSADNILWLRNDKSN
jgi:hypothetical protein